MEWIRFVVAAFFIIFGVVMEAIAVFGVYKFKFVLNRMHAAAIGDTLAFGFITLGTIIIKGFSMFSLKAAIILLFLWMASSVSSHVLSRMEITIDEDKIRDECEVQEE
jgi:multicomponent Na+:H+ antiporter subunit G